MSGYKSCSRLQKYSVVNFTFVSGLAIEMDGRPIRGNTCLLLTLHFTFSLKILLQVAGHCRAHLSLLLLNVFSFNSACHECPFSFFKDELHNRAVEKTQFVTSAFKQHKTFLPPKEFNYFYCYCSQPQNMKP